MKSLILAAVTAVAMGTALAAHAENLQPVSYSAAQAAASGAAHEVADSASTQAGSSAASLSALLADWDLAGFSAPSKPSQYRVLGRNGYATSGQEYNAMVSLIRAAADDVRDGRDQDATVKIAKARVLLATAARNSSDAQASSLRQTGPAPRWADSAMVPPDVNRDDLLISNRGAAGN